MTEPGLVRTMGVTRFPTVVVYARGPRGVTQLGTIGDCDNAEALVDRLRTLDLGLSTPAKADPSVTPSSLAGDIYASQQYSAHPCRRRLLRCRRRLRSRSRCRSRRRWSRRMCPGGAHDGVGHPGPQSEPHDPAALQIIMGPARRLSSTPPR